MALSYRARKRAGLVHEYSPRIPVGSPLRKFVISCLTRRLATQNELAKFLGTSQATIHRIWSQ